MWRAILSVLAWVSFAICAWTPAVAAQVTTASQDTSVGEARLAAFVKAYVAITAVRDSAHAHMALSRNKTDQNQRELRDALRKQIEDIVMGQGLTMEQYNRITFVISRDEAWRKRFEELLGAAAPKPQTR